MRRRAVAGTSILLAALAVGAITIQELRAGPGSPGSTRSGAPTLAAAVSGLRPPPRPAFTVGHPTLLDRNDTRSRFAPVLEPVDARARPRSDSDRVALVASETEEGTTNIVQVLGEARLPDGAWVHVRLPVLPNNRTGWVRRRVLGGYQFVDTHLVVDRRRFTATLLRDGRAVFHANVGVGRAAWPTPTGHFYIRDKLSGFDNPFYGPIAFGTSARSAVLTDWPGGGFVGIHGTNQPGLIPGPISHGCIRMRNEDIVRLARLMPVGTPLTIQ